MAELTDATKQELRQAGIPETAFDLFSERGLGALIPKLGITFLELTAEKTLATMPVEGNTQPYGLLHGGASAALLETLGSFAANAAAPKGQVAVGTELNITHVRPALTGLVTGTATAVKIGRTQCIHTVEIRDEAGRITSIGRMTNNFVIAR